MTSGPCLSLRLTLLTRDGPLCQYQQAAAASGGDADMSRIRPLMFLAHPLATRTPVSQCPPSFSKKDAMPLSRPPDSKAEGRRFEPVQPLHLTRVGVAG